ncbi:MAG: Holliday junction resolvase RuvX [Actinomycetota bacterium]|nr:Holliday junction resolvase RuvX [Actinomycetota bacterium]
MRAGVRIGVDVGSVRVGVATSDAGGLLATPVATLSRDSDGGQDLRRLAELVQERAALEVVVGLPRSLSGAEGPAAAAARAYAGQLAALVLPVPIRLVDERMSTVTAHQALRSSGVRERKGRKVVDQVAAVVILQHALDAERSTGHPPGELVVHSK